MTRSRRIDATVWWSWACVAILLSGGLSLPVVGEPDGVLAGPLGAVLGSAYPALLLVGALRFAERPVPGWVLPAAIGFGLVRGLAKTAGLPALAHLPAFLVEPLLFAWTAWVLAQAPASTRLPRVVLPAALLVLGALDGFNHLGMRGGAGPSDWVIASYTIASPLLLALQLTACLHTSHREQERLEAAAAEQAARYKAVSELSSDYSFSYRVFPDGRVHREWITDAVTRITGHPADCFDGLGWMQIVHPDDRERVHRLATSLGDRVDARSMDMRIVTPEGEDRFLNIRFSLVRGTGAGTMQVVGAGRDITDRVRAEEERRRVDQHLQELQRMEGLGRLAGGIAHDFNNVLTIVLGNARLALEDTEPDTVQRARLARIRSAAEYAAGLTDQILTFSGEASVSLEPVDLSELVDGMAELLGASVGSAVKLELQLSTEPALVMGDPNQLRQVVHNLVINASEATGTGGGAIRLRTATREYTDEDVQNALGELREGGRYAVIEVSDSGCGLPPEVRERAFDPFFSTKQSGRGLGLATVLGVTRGHHGGIRIESTEGTGTCFEILLPPTERVAEPDAPGRQDPDATVAEGTVLFIDDDEGVLEVASEFLQRSGFRVLPASSGAEAIALARSPETAIDAAVLDLMMPDMSGQEVFAALRDLRPDLPVVLASGYDREHVAERFALLGVSAFLQKPFEPEELVASVTTAIDS